MIITRTPFRISFFGGGTDYPVYYREHGGAVLSTTINKYCYVTVRYLPPFFDHKFRIRYTKREETQTVDEIKHPSVRECLKFMNINEGIEMVHTSDIPAMSGIGSSSAFTVGLLNALYSLQGKMVTKRGLAFAATYVEQKMVKENVGSQDQVAAAFGGFNKIEFATNGDFFVKYILLDNDRLEYIQNCLLFYFLGFSRISSEVAGVQIKETPKNIDKLMRMQKMVDDAIFILGGRPEDLNDFGKLLHESWMLKRSLTDKISNEMIDQVYETAIRNGALGGKLCGAGGSGFMLFFVPIENQPKVKEALKDFLLVPFRLETLGSHVVFYST